MNPLRNSWSPPSLARDSPEEQDGRVPFINHSSPPYPILPFNISSPPSIEHSTIHPMGPPPPPNSKHHHYHPYAWTPPPSRSGLLEPLFSPTVNWQESSSRMENVVENEKGDLVEPTSLRGSHTLRPLTGTPMDQHHPQPFFVNRYTSSDAQQTKTFDANGLPVDETQELDRRETKKGLITVKRNVLDKFDKFDKTQQQDCGRNERAKSAGL